MPVSTKQDLQSQDKNSLNQLGNPKPSQPYTMKCKIIRSLLPKAFLPFWTVHPYYSVVGRIMGFPQWLSSKKYACNAGDTGDAGSIPGLGRFPGGNHGNLFQYSCLENPMDREAWRATVHKFANNRTRLKQLSMHAPICVSNTGINTYQTSSNLILG